MGGWSSVCSRERRVDFKWAPGIKRTMEIPEQYPPNKPNFGMVVALSVAALFILLVVGYLFLHHEAGHLMPAKPATHAQIDLPAPVYATDAGYFAAPA